MISQLLDFVRFRLASSAVWRSQLAKRFPDDLRNNVANRVLSRLAMTPDGDVNASLVEALMPYEGTRTLDRALEEVARQVGFQTTPPSLNAFLKSVHELVLVADVPPVDVATFADRGLGR